MSDEPTKDVTLDAESDLAGEYVLGTLAREERADAERQLAIDPTFAREVAAWEQRLAPLLDAIPEAEPPEGVLFDVRQKIGATTHDAIVSPEISGETANIIRFDAAERAMRRWRRIAVASGALAACLLAFVFFQEFYPQDLTAERTYVAVLESDSRTPAFVAVINADTGSIALRRVGAAPDSGKSLELWALGGGRTSPESLGLIGTERQPERRTLGFADANELGATVFAVSLEPEGGSKTGLPTGPVMFTGKLVPAPRTRPARWLDRFQSLWK